MITTNPLGVSWPALAIAAGAGLMLLAVGRRSTRRRLPTPIPQDVVEDPNDKLDAVLPEVRVQFLSLAQRFHQQTGFKLRVRSGRRTCADQRGLFAIGRTVNPSAAKVTFANGCQSWHVLGRAVDADPVDEQGKLSGSCAVYTEAGEIWESMGGRWGGRFPGFGPCGDAGHFEWRPGLSIGDICPDPNACESVVASHGIAGVEWTE